MPTPWPPMLDHPHIRAQLAAFDIVETSQLVGLLAQPPDRARFAAVVGLGADAVDALVTWLEAAGHAIDGLPDSGPIQFDPQTSPPRSTR